MSGIMTAKLDQLLKALTENSPITKDLIVASRQEYTKLRVCTISTPTFFQNVPKPDFLNSISSEL
jgi:hypothetical protein